ncbi:MAG: thioesterase domain-containing protein, partial [Syntrophothermus sp.]
HYVSEIMSVEKEGPYALAGFSLGGKIAYEMARQLHERGKVVSFLGMIDTVADNPAERKSFSYAMNYFSWNVKTLFKSEADENSIESLKRKMKGLKRKVVGMDLNVLQEEKQSMGKSSELPGYLKEVHRANRKADREYVIKTYKGEVHLFKAKNQTFYIKDTMTYGWDKYAQGGVVIHEIPGEHSSIFAPPNDKYFADVLQRHLSMIHEESPVS